MSSAKPEGASPMETALARPSEASRTAAVRREGTTRNAPQSVGSAWPSGRPSIPGAPQTRRLPPTARTRTENSPEKSSRIRPDAGECRSPGTRRPGGQSARVRRALRARSRLHPSEGAYEVHDLPSLVGRQFRALPRHVFRAIGDGRVDPAVSVTLHRRAGQITGRDEMLRHGAVPDSAGAVAR